MAAVIGALRAELSATIAKFREDMKNAGLAVREFATKAEAQGKRLQRVGAQMTVALTAPLVAFGVKAVKAATESAQALGQLDAALKSTEFQAGRTLKQLQAQAKALESISTFDDDDILKDVTTNLTKFGNVVGEVFDKAQLAIVNMASRTGDLSSAAQTVGRALQDPIRGITLLRRAGIDLGDEQEKLIKNLVATGRGAQAQAIILKALETAYGGAAKALRDATPTAAMQQQWRDLQETVGEIVLTVLPPLLDFLQKIAEAFNSLSPTMQRVIVYGGILAAVVGPLVTIFGTLMRVAAFLAPVITAIGAALAGLSAPVWAVVAAVTALVGALLIFWRAAGKLLTGDFSGAWEEAKKAAREMWDDLTSMFSSKPVEVPVVLTGPDGKPLKPGKTNFNIPGKKDATETGTFPDSVAVTSPVDLSDAFTRPVSSEMQRIVDEFRRNLLEPIRERRATEQAEEARQDVREMRGDVGLVSEEALRRQEIARDLFERQIAAEEEIANLEVERAEAELKGDTDAMERLNGLIVEQQRLLDLVKATTVEQVEQHEKAKASQKKSWTENAQDAADGFFKDVSEGFKRLAREGGDVFEMLRMALRESLFKAFVDPAIGAAVDALQSIIKGLFNAIKGALSNAFAGGFAEGGMIPPGQWAVVGENGPELAIGGNRGMRVFSNEDSRAMLGGGGNTYVTNNIRTNDTYSFQRTSRQIARTTKRALEEA